MSKCQMTKPGIVRSTGVGADHEARSYRESASGFDERMNTALDIASHPRAPARMYHSFAVRSCSITSVGETASCLRSTKATVGVVHVRAFPVDIVMILLKLSETTRYTWTIR